MTSNDQSREAQIKKHRPLELSAVLSNIAPSPYDACTMQGQRYYDLAAVCIGELWRQVQEYKGLVDDYKTGRLSTRHAAVDAKALAEQVYESIDNAGVSFDAVYQPIRQALAAQQGDGVPDGAALLKKLDYAREMLARWTPEHCRAQVLEAIDEALFKNGGRAYGKFAAAPQPAKDGQ